LNDYDKQTFQIVACGLALLAVGIMVITAQPNHQSQFIDSLSGLSCSERIILANQQMTSGNFYNAQFALETAAMNGCKYP
jgi:hypothetical protein